VINTKFAVEPTGLIQWVAMSHPHSSEEVIARCNPAVIQPALEPLGASVVSAVVNSTGKYEQLPGLVATDLPPFCDLQVQHQSPGGHTIHTSVWVPVNWNSRFLGCGGGGNRTSIPWLFPDPVRIATLPRAIKCRHRLWPRSWQSAIWPCRVHRRQSDPDPRPRPTTLQSARARVMSTFRCP
jgi:hypothetical protein